MIKALTIFCGGSNRELADAICRYVEVPLGRAEVSRFSDGESFAEIGENVCAVDLHAGQIQGFFNIPFDHIYAMPVVMEVLRARHTAESVVVSPDAGGVERARAYSKRLNATLAIIDKRRSSPNVSEVMHIIGDVKGKDAILVDDMIDTAGTIAQAAKAVMDAGARAGSVSASR